MRNVELTKQRILDAATREFSEHGFAGARVDRIATEANANKASIYTYFGNKEKLFEAVFRAIMNEVVRDVPMDPADLPGYLGRRLEWQFRNPDLARIMLWGLLELEQFAQREGAAAAHARKVELITQGQQQGLIGTSFTPEQVLDLIDALARPQMALHGTETIPEATFQAYRQTAVAALRRLVDPSGD